MTNRFNRKTPKRLQRSDIVGPGQCFQQHSALFHVDEVEVVEDGRLKVTTHVVARALCAETLVHGETHPTVFMWF